MAECFKPIGLKKIVYKNEMNYLAPRVRGIKQAFPFNFDANVEELNSFWLSPCD